MMNITPDVSWAYFPVTQIKCRFVSDVKTIFNSVLESVSEEPDRKFIMVESSFFSRWYEELDEEDQELVFSLVESGN